MLNSATPRERSQPPVRSSSLRAAASPSPAAGATSSAAGPVVSGKSANSTSTAASTAATSPELAFELQRLHELKRQVSAQEQKLTALRTTQQQRSAAMATSSAGVHGNHGLESENEAMKTLVFAKEKELALALMKVAELTRQLEQLRGGNTVGLHADNSEKSVGNSVGSSHPRAIVKPTTAPPPPPVSLVANEGMINVPIVAVNSRSVADGHSTVNSTSVTVQHCNDDKKKHTANNVSNNNNNINNNNSPDDTPYAKLVHTMAALARNHRRSEHVHPKRSESMRTTSSSTMIEGTRPGSVGVNGISRPLSDGGIGKESLVNQVRSDVAVGCFGLDICIQRVPPALPPTDPKPRGSFDRSQPEKMEVIAQKIEVERSSAELVETSPEKAAPCRSNGAVQFSVDNVLSPKDCQSPSEKLDDVGNVAGRVSSGAQMMSCFAPRPYGATAVPVTLPRATVGHEVASPVSDVPASGLVSAAISNTAAAANQPTVARPPSNTHAVKTTAVVVATVSDAKSAPISKFSVSRAPSTVSSTSSPSIRSTTSTVSSSKSAPTSRNSTGAIAALAPAASASTKSTSRTSTTGVAFAIATAPVATTTSKTAAGSVKDRNVTTAGVTKSTTTANVSQSSSITRTPTPTTVSNGAAITSSVASGAAKTPSVSSATSRPPIPKTVNIPTAAVAPTVTIATTSGGRNVATTVVVSSAVATANKPAATVSVSAAMTTAATTTTTTVAKTTTSVAKTPVTTTLTSTPNITTSVATKTTMKSSAAAATSASTTVLAKSVAVSAESKSDTVTTSTTELSKDSPTYTGAKITTNASTPSKPLFVYTTTRSTTNPSVAPPSPSTAPLPSTASAATTASSRPVTSAALSARPITSTSMASAASTDTNAVTASTKMTHVQSKVSASSVGVGAIANLAKSMASSTAESTSVLSQRTPISRTSTVTVSETSVARSEVPQSSSQKSSSAIVSSTSVVKGSISSTSATVGLPESSAASIIPAEDVVDGPSSLAEPPDAKLTVTDNSKTVDTSTDSVSTALSVLLKSSNSGQSTLPDAAVGETPSSPKSAYRYGLRGTVSGIYRRKLGSISLDQYARNMEELYGTGSSPEFLTGTVQSPTTFTPSEIRPHPTLTSPAPVSLSSPTVSFRDAPLDGTPLSQQRKACARPSVPPPPPPAEGLSEAGDKPVDVDSPTAPPRTRPRCMPPSIARRAFLYGDVESPTVEELKTLDAAAESASAAIPDGKIVSGSVPAFDPSSDFAALYIDDEDWRGITDHSSISPAFRPFSSFRVKRTSTGKPMKTVRFDPSALLHSAVVEGDLEMVKFVAPKVIGGNTSGDDAFSALKNAVTNHQPDVTKFLIQYGCDVNMVDCDGWAPLHFAAAVNDVEMSRLLVDCGACILSKTSGDHELPEQKCCRNAPYYDECIQYLRDAAARLGTANNATVYATCAYSAASSDELSFTRGDRIKILRRGDGRESEWWWASLDGREGYVPQNLLSINAPVPQPTPAQTAPE